MSNCWESLLAFYEDRSKQMTKLNENICKNCGCIYSLIYTNKTGSEYLLTTSYCSKSCAGKALKPLVSKEELRGKATAYIEARGSYCTKDELCKGVGHSSKTFLRHGLKISELNADAGMTKPKSKFQDNVGQVLTKSFENVEYEKTFDGLVGVKGHPLRVDFYIPEINTVVEADGSQHSDPKHPWKEWNNGTVAEYDKIKDDYFAKKGIRLVRVPYKPRVKESDVLSRLV